MHVAARWRCDRQLSVERHLPVQSGSGPPGEALSRRQAEVLGLVKAGFDNTEIAERLGISVRTVRVHTDALKMKLGVRRRSELIRVDVSQR
ncbi:helix-turn-helix domain-containing protein [Gaiella occulta]|uniref:response regulator transcription factor n=1 Tax=Gaiella occulta TaxID=1002870 RepID=UPI000E0B5A35